MRKLAPIVVALALALAVAPAARAETSAPRKITFNGRSLTAADTRTIARLEKRYGRQVPDGNYWYDDASGAVGTWGGPTLAMIGAGLGLGGKLPANASGGGDGRLTGVFINGRELHPLDVQGLRALLGQVYPGRWWVDGQGNAGYEGGPALVNLYVVARQRAAARGGSSSHYQSDGRGNNAFVSPGCTAVNGHLGASSSSGSYSYYIGCD
jgi:hypothetical protein